MNLTDYTEQELIDALAKKKEAKKALPVPLSKEWPKSPIGTWHVTTEDDCEGRSVRDLGIHTGHVADIALQLASKQYYSLKFEAPPPKKEIEVLVPGNEVNIHLDIKSGTWDMNQKQLTASVNAWLKRDLPKTSVKVEDCNYFASVKIVKG